MQALRRLLNIFKELDPSIQRDLLEGSDLLRSCELELGEESKGFKLKLPEGCILETRRNTFHEDLPWDAYLKRPDSSVSWADGWTELQAIKKVLQV